MRFEKNAGFFTVIVNVKQQLLTVKYKLSTS